MSGNSQTQMFCKFITNQLGFIISNFKVNL